VRVVNWYVRNCFEHARAIVVRLRGTSPAHTHTTSWLGARYSRILLLSLSILYYYYYYYIDDERLTSTIFSARFLIFKSRFPTSISRASAFYNIEKSATWNTLSIWILNRERQFLSQLQCYPLQCPPPPTHNRHITCFTGWFNKIKRTM